MHSSAIARPPRHPIVGMIIGLTAGFVGAAATIASVEWLAEGDAPVALAAVIEGPDLERYCSDQGMAYVEIGNGDDRRRCVGSVDGVWRVVAISPDDVCRDQFGTGASRLPDVGTDWLCLAGP